MKMIIIVYNEAVDEEVLGLLRACNQAEYTKWTKVMGRGKHSEPHLLTHVWPKANNVLMACVEDGTASTLLEGVRKLRQTAGKEGVKAFVLPVEAVS